MDDRKERQKQADNMVLADSAESAESTETARDEDGAKIQWHPGFCGAFRREFRKYRDYLRFEEELPLTAGPLFVDLLVIEMIQPVPMENELGKIFRKYNICEYKGPDDALTIDDFYKTAAYACLYKCSGQTVDEIPTREITVSLIRDAYPRRLFQTLEADGFTATEQYPGVYYLGHRENEGGLGLFFPTQVIVTSRLSREAHSGLRILRRPADPEDILRFLTEARQDAEPGDRANVDAILVASMAANAELYARIGRGNQMMMYPALRVLLQDELDERWNEGREEGREEGRNEGLKVGIFNLVSAYRDEFGLDNAAITERLAKRYNLTKEQAARYVAAPGA